MSRVDSENLCGSKVEWTGQKNKNKKWRFLFTIIIDRCESGQLWIGYLCVHPPVNIGSPTTASYDKANDWLSGPSSPEKELNWNANFGNRKSPSPVAIYYLPGEQKINSPPAEAIRRKSQSNKGWGRRTRNRSEGLAEGHFKLCTKTDFYSSAGRRRSLWRKSN